MNRALPRAASACTLALGLSLGGLVWADTATLPPGPLIDIDSTANSLGTAVDAATTKSNSLTSNSVTLTSGAVGGIAVGAINLEDTDAVTGNTVSIDGGTVAGSVLFSPFATYGVGVAGGYGGGTAAVSGNTVTISGGTVNPGLVVGGMGGSSATGNTVTVSNGDIGIGIVGGFAIDGSASAAATGNTINITGGTVASGIVGGRVYAPLYLCSLPAGASYNASNNTVTISGTPDLTAATLIGGAVVLVSSVPMPCLVPPGGYPFTLSNNTLNLHSAGISVQGVNSFDNLNFYLPATLSTSTPVLTVTDSSMTIPANMKVDSSTSATLTDGEIYTLINVPAPNGLDDPSTGFPFTASATLATGTITDATGATHGYTVDVDASGNNLVLKIGAPPSVPPSSTAAVPATGPASLALLALLLAGTGWLARRGAKARR